MSEFKKGQIVLIKDLFITKNLQNIPGRIIHLTKTTVRVRLQSPIKIKMGKKTLGGIYTHSSYTTDVELSPILTLKSIMRRHDKKNIKSTKSKIKANKRTSKE